MPSGGTLAKVALFGAVAGPLVDAVHNQVLLQYDILPISVAAAKSSLLIPPLLAFAYVVLGAVLPALARLTPLKTIPGLGPEGTGLVPVRDPGIRAGAAVASTIGIIKFSEVLTSAGVAPSVSLPVLAAVALVQWAALDGSASSLAVAVLAGLLGPVAETPLIAAGCWHYISPDVFVGQGLLGVGAAGWGLSAITGPCYFAVTTDAIALTRWLESQRGGRVQE